jgi:hypothetical protein
MEREVRGSVMKPNWLQLLAGIFVGGVVGAFAFSLLGFLVFKGANPSNFPDPLGYWMFMLCVTAPLGGVVGAVIGCTIAEEKSK